MIYCRSGAVRGCTLFARAEAIAVGEGDGNQDGASSVGATERPSERWGLRSDREA